MTRRNTLIIVSIAALVALGALIYRWMTVPPVPNPEPGRGAAVEVVRMGTFSKALGNAPFHIALEKGWFREHPILSRVRVTYTEFNDRPAIAAAFSRNELDYLFSAEIPAILIRAQGEDISFAVASTYALQEVLVPRASAATQVADLRGRRVAVQAGTSSHFGLVKILNTAGLAPTDVRLAFIPAAEGRAAFEAGRLDAWAVWAPWVETQEVSGRGRVLRGSEARIYSVGSVRNSFATAHPAEAKAIVEVLQRAKKWCQENPDEGARIISERLGFDLPAVRAAWTKFDWSAQLDSPVRQEFQEKAGFLAKEGLSRNNRIVDVSKEMFR